MWQGAIMADEIKKATGIASGGFELVLRWLV